MKGFGTVVTGTLVAGELAVGDEVEVLPSGRRARVRGLQVHGEPVERAVAGTRTAVNLAGVEVEELARGEVLARPGDAAGDLDDRRRDLACCAGAGALGGRGAGARPRGERRGAGPGAPARGRVARARAKRPRPAPAREPGRRRARRPARPPLLLAGRHDRRGASSSTRCRRGAGPPTGPRSSGCATPRACVEAAEAMVEEAGAAGHRGAAPGGPAHRARWPGSRAGARREPGARRAGTGPGGRSSPARRSPGCGAAALEALERLPPRPAAQGRRCRARSCAAASSAGAGLAAFERVLADLAAAGQRPARSRRGGPRRATRCASPPARRRPASCSSRPRRGGRPRGRRGRARSPSAAARTRSSSSAWRGCWSREQRARRGWGTGLLVAPRARSRRSRQQVRERWPPGSQIDVAAFKEMTGLSRKYVIPLLEYLDRERVTRRVGQRPGRALGSRRSRAGPLSGASVECERMAVPKSDEKRRAGGAIRVPFVRRCQIDYDGRHSRTAPSS